MTTFRATSRALAVVLLASLTVSGCWDRKEINDVGFALASGIDLREDGQMVTTIQVAVPGALSRSPTGGGKQNQDAVMMFQAEGKTLDEMRMDVQAQLSRVLNTSHRRVIVIGEEMARHGVGELADEVSRSPMNRLRTFVVVARGTTARSLLAARYPLEAYPSEGIRELEKMDFGTETTLRDFFISSTLPGSQPNVTCFSLKGDKQPRFRTDGVAIFRDLKLVDFLDGEEADRFLLVRHKKKDGVVKVKFPSGGDHHVNVAFREVNSKPKVEVVDGKPRVSYQIYAAGIVMENTTRLDMMNPKHLEEINRAVQKKLTNDTVAMIRHLQKLKADALQVGTEIYRKEPDVWDQVKKDWPETFAAMDIPVRVEVNIRQVGMVGPSLHLQQEEIKK